VQHYRRAVSSLLIVNADDLGRSAGINEGTFEAHRRGLVSSATLMVGYRDARAAAAEAARYPELGVGLHVALSGGEPTLPASQVPSLLDANGRLPAKPDPLAVATPAEVEAEVRNQFRLFVEIMGRLPAHLDGHHHCLRLPVVLDAITALAREHDLPVRRASPEVAHRLERERITTSDVFVEDFFGDGATIETLEGILRVAAARGGSTEVMCHPGYPDDALRAASSYADQREAEIGVLCDPGLLALTESLGLRRGHFGHLAGVGAGSR
jgi:predicted glycoside hydrolase/deacetylase ChbG (UPF0249 family)